MKNSGFTFVEVLIATAISIVGASLFFFFVLNVRTHKTGVDSTLSVKELLTDNVVEAKGTEFVNLPSFTQCLVRTYNLQKEFVSETKLNSSPCPTPSLAQDQIQVMWEVSGPDTISADFSTTSLKLPTSLVAKITFHAWSYNNNKNLTHNQIVIFKK